MPFRATQGIAGAVLTGGQALRIDDVAADRASTRPSTV